MELERTISIEPILLPSPPPGLHKQPSLTLDEFFLIDTNFTVQAIQSLDSSRTNMTISEACQSMRVPLGERDDSYCFRLSISCKKELDEDFRSPKMVQKVDMYGLFWPVKDASVYLKEENRLFYAFQSGYESQPHSVYGGMSEWLQVISGEIELTLIKPTKLNLTKYSSWEPPEQFKPEVNTTIIHTLVSDSFIVIPCGWIRIFKANQDTCALAGRFLNVRSLAAQLDCLARDIINTNGKYASKRDVEIRCLYWITIARLLDDHMERSAKRERGDTVNEEMEESMLSSLNVKTLELLKRTLTDWRAKHKSICTPMNLYAPSGIQLSLIVTDLTNYIKSRSTPRKPL